MSSKKRRRDDAETTPITTDNVHASRKRRLEYSNADAALAKIYNDLRDDLPYVRSAATVQLLRNLLDPNLPTSDEDATTASSSSPTRIDTAITRLIKGACSGAKAARLGFSMALAEVLRLKFPPSTSSTSNTTAKSHVQASIPALIHTITTLSTPEGKSSGEERRNNFLGRRFALQAVLQSGILRGDGKEADKSVILDALAELAGEKGWLRTEVGAVVKRFLEEEEAELAKGKEEGEESARLVLEGWSARGLLKSPEGVALWLTVRRRFPGVKVVKGVWHHGDPLAAQERAALTKILLKNAVDGDEEGAGKMGGARQTTPSFAWETILGTLYEKGNEQELERFWNDCVASPMFSTSSSTERKALGLQIFTQAVRTAPAAMLQAVLHPNIIRCIIDQRAKPDRMLFEATKLPLEQISARAKKDPSAAGEILAQLLRCVSGNLDKLTKKTFEAVSAAVPASDLENVVEETALQCAKIQTSEQKEAEAKRRFVADFWLQLVRARRGSSDALFSNIDSEQSSLQKWLSTLLRTLAGLTFTQQPEVSPPISDASRFVFQERLSSMLSDLLDQSAPLASLAPALVAKELYASREKLHSSLGKETQKLLKTAHKLQQSQKGASADAARLLLALGALQVYRNEPDSEAILADIVQQYTGDQEEGTDSAVNLTELLLSFVSKQSALFRKLAEQVFRAFASGIPPEGLQSMIDVLTQKESLAGQQELFQNGDDDEMDVDDDVEEEDVEELSDVELVNGVVISGPTNGKVDDNSAESDDNESDDDEQDDSDSDSGSDDGSNSEAEATEDNALERDIAKALGAAGLDADSDSDGSDMDDDQMLEVDKALVTVLTEHKKLANQKKDKRDARENIVNFKNRVCDLLMTYVKSQYSNPAALDLIHPLVELTRTTSSQATAKKALDVLEQYFAACKKHKALPNLEQSEDGFTILSAVHDEMREGGSKLHASACSKSSQFLAKILVSIDADNWDKIALMYVQLQKEWRTDTKSKIHVSVFNDWHGWCMAR